MLRFLHPAPPIPELPASSIPSEYRRLRWQVFTGIFVGYAGFYLVRSNFSLALPEILAAHPEYTKAQLGGAMTGLLTAYGLSKFIMGSVSDRSNPRWFMALGLLLSAAVQFGFGVWPWLYSSLVLIVVLQSLNGWFNGMGWPPCGKSMVHWWSTRERGGIVALWNCAHNVGGALVAVFGTWAMAHFGGWGAKFWFNALVAAAVAVLIAVLVRDTPQSCGLPPVEKFRNDYPPDYSADHERTFTFREIFFRYVLSNRFLWFIALANAFVYFVRFGVVNWIPTYLQTAKGFDFKASGLAWTAFELAGIPGTILCGWLSDKVFKARRAPATILFMGLTLVGLIIYGSNRHGPLWIDHRRADDRGLFRLRPDHDDRLARTGLGAEESGRHCGRVHRPVRLFSRFGAFRLRHRKDRGPLRVERRFPGHDRLQHTRHGFQRAHAGTPHHEFGRDVLISSVTCALSSRFLAAATPVLRPPAGHAALPVR
jgi:OPA family glycerol-3-phosphate transporter-like MFS transporter